MPSKTSKYLTESLCDEMGDCVLSGMSVNKTAMQNI